MLRKTNLLLLLAELSHRLWWSSVVKFLFKNLFLPETETGCALQKPYFEEYLHKVVLVLIGLVESDWPKICLVLIVPVTTLIANAFLILSNTFSLFYEQ